MQTQYGHISFNPCDDGTWEVYDELFHVVLGTIDLFGDLFTPARTNNSLCRKDMKAICKFMKEMEGAPK